MSAPRSRRADAIPAALELQFTGGAALVPSNSMVERNVLVKPANAGWLHRNRSNTEGAHVGSFSATPLPPTQGRRYRSTHAASLRRAAPAAEREGAAAVLLWGVGCVGRAVVPRGLRSTVAGAAAAALAAAAVVLARLGGLGAALALLALA
jgi:hypothetical protein